MQSIPALAPHKPGMDSFHTTVVGIDALHIETSSERVRDVRAVA
ncbi:hypothetical protein ACFYWN_41895 [Streptomyces sp. NPDC002917]